MVGKRGGNWGGGIVAGDLGGQDAQQVGPSSGSVAVEKGLPALAGVDPLIAAALGERYHPHNGGTVNADHITAALRLRGERTWCFPDRVVQIGMRWKDR